MNVLKNLISIFPVVIALLFPLHTFAEEAPDALVKRVSMEVLETAKKDKNIKRGDMNHVSQLVEEKVMPYVDFKKSTSLVVGKYWRQATPEQREELTKQFHDLLFYTYASAISQIDEGHKLEFQPLRAKPGATDVIVNSRIIQPKNPEPVTIGYRLEKQENNWKIYDVNIMGAWLVETYKTSFTNEISRSGIDGLIRVLQDKNQNLKQNSRKS